ncbi:MAG: TIGR04255 family protein [Muribaculaceae bacterium]
MDKKFPLLANPPIVVAICQIKFPLGSIPLDGFKQYEEKIQRRFPIRVDNINAKIDVPKEIKLGENPFNATSIARINAYDYRNKEQNIRLHISEDSIIITDEQKYSSWDNFKEKIQFILNTYSELLEGKNIERVSIRFINRFIFDTFEDPSKYFNIIISTSDGHDFDYDVMKYGFRFTMSIPDSDIISLVNHNLETSPSQKYVYTLDIDVLDHAQLVFYKDTIEAQLDRLNSILTGIFFNNVTEKTLELCN